jgi:hypothetical protein
MEFQTVVVTVVALGGAAFIVRRVLGLGRRDQNQAACPSCTSGSGACATTPAKTPAATSDVHPLTLVRSKTR